MGKSKKLIEFIIYLFIQGWKLPARIITLSDEKALIMPYVYPVPETKWSDPIVKNAIKKAVEQFANLGYFHQDLHPRHVGLYKDSLTSVLKAVLFDLENVKSVKKGKETEEAITKMMKVLKLD